MLVAIRTIIAFVWLFIVARIIGPKQVSQLSFFDYVSGITIGSMASTLAVDSEVRAVAVFTGLGMFALFAVAMSWLRHSRYPIRVWLDGEPILLVSDGRLHFDSLGFVRMTVDELLTLLRREGVFDLQEVDWVWFEPTGQISVRRKAPYNTVTLRDLDLPAPAKPQPHVVIIDGQVLPETLRETGHDEGWLMDRLAEQGLPGPGPVAVGQVSGESLFVWLRDGQSPPVPAPRREDLLRLTMRKAQAELELFALDTEDPQARRLYQQSAQDLQHVMREVEPLLR